jgi:hypothetical protein
MAATDQVREIDHVVRLGQYHTPILGGVEKATQSWKRGAVLIADALGSVAEAGSDPIAAILGIALADASGVTGAACQSIPALPGLLFEATLEDQSNGDHALALTDTYQGFGMKKVSATGFWYLDENDTSGVCGVVMQLVSPVGTVQGRVLFTFRDAVTAWT